MIKMYISRSTEKLDQWSNGATDQQIKRSASIRSNAKLKEGFRGRGEERVIVGAAI